MPAWATGGAADEPCGSSLELQFVYGVRGADCRRNCFFTASGEIWSCVSTENVLTFATSRSQPTNRRRPLVSNPPPEARYR